MWRFQFVSRKICTQVWLLRVHKNMYNLLSVSWHAFQLIFTYTHPRILCNRLFLHLVFYSTIVVIILQWIGGGKCVPPGRVWALTSQADAWFNTWGFFTSAWWSKTPWLWHAGWSQVAAPAQRSPGGPHADTGGPQPSIGGSASATSTVTGRGKGIQIVNFGCRTYEVCSKSFGPFCITHEWYVHQYIASCGW